MGRERVPHHVRRLPPPGRTARRPVRPPAAVPHRHRALHVRLAGLRALDVAGDARDRARGAGRRWRDRLRGRAVADDDAVHDAGGAGEGDGHLRLRRLGRRVARRAARRHPHRRPQLALDLPRQHSRRDPRRRAHAVAHPRCARADGRQAPRRLGSRHRNRLADDRRLRDRERERRRMAHPSHAWLAGRLRRASRRLPPHRVPGLFAAHAARPLPPPQPLGLQRHRRALGGIDVRVVLPLRALPPGGARLQPARGRPRVPAREPHHGRLLDRPVGEARHALRDQDPCGDRARPGGDRRPRSLPAPPSTEASAPTCCCR